MSTFTKLDSGIVHSTIWVQPHDVLRVWIALLALADQHGYARTAAPSLANLCMISVDRMREILLILESPDEDSRSEAEEGRRIVKIEGGWMLVNHAAYRAKRDPDADRERKKDWDRKHRPSGHARQSDAVRRSPLAPTQAEADADTEARAKTKGASAPLVLPDWLPADAWQDWLQYRNSRKGWTHKARALSLRTLTELFAQGNDPRAAINQSIERGWTGLFPVHGRTGVGNATTGKLSASEQTRAAIAARREHESANAVL